MIFVTGRNKRAIEDHFDKAYELETELERKSKHELLDMVRAVLPDGVRCIYIRQAEPLGLGHAVLCAAAGGRRRAVRGDPGRRPDRLAAAGDRRAWREIFAQRARRCSAWRRCRATRRSSYGIVTVDAMRRATWRASAASSRSRRPADAPSNLAVVGRYVLTPRIFDLLATATPGAGGEIQLTDAHRGAARARAACSRCACPGGATTAARKLGYLQATVEFGLRHPEIGEEFARYLKNTLDSGMPDVQQAWAFLENSDLVASARRWRRRCSALAAEIRARSQAHTRWCWR